ncbi:hypothetical protein U9M48_045084 [Paspalum notatum var. saurae]|uniref:Uncharacterized protein n=1 Tax=Paspalum notatum var. saurae TaxID=547442 RepID=A0AAQ3UWJ7_PASNO
MTCAFKILTFSANCYLTLSQQMALGNNYSETNLRWGSKPLSQVEWKTWDSPFPVRSIKRLKRDFLHFGSFKVKDGSQICFWEDNWMVSSQEPDVLKCNLTQNGVFLVKSHYQALINLDVCNMNKILWKKGFLLYLRRVVVLIMDNC